MSLAPRPSSYPLASGERQPQQIVNAIRSLQIGQVSYTGTVTLATQGTGTTPVTQTVVQTPVAGKGQLVFLFPQNADAATEVVTTWAGPVVVNGEFTINHLSNTNIRTFSWMVLG